MAGDIIQLILAGLRGNTPGATAERQDSETTTFLLSSPRIAFIVSQYVNPRNAARRG